MEQFTINKCFLRNVNCFLTYIFKTLDTTGKKCEIPIDEEIMYDPGKTDIRLHGNYYFIGSVKWDNNIYIS